MPLVRRPRARRVPALPQRPRPGRGRSRRRAAPAATRTSHYGELGRAAPTCHQQKTWRADGPDRAPRAHALPAGRRARRDRLPPLPPRRRGRQLRAHRHRVRDLPPRRPGAGAQPRTTSGWAGSTAATAATCRRPGKRRRWTREAGGQPRRRRTRAFAQEAAQERPGVSAPRGGAAQGEVRRRAASRPALAVSGRLTPPADGQHRPRRKERAWISQRCLSASSVGRTRSRSERQDDPCTRDSELLRGRRSALDHAPAATHSLLTSRPVLAVGGRRQPPADGERRS